MVAELLPRDADLYDIVIIDEASQMLPCDALGAIARGRQAVIVGDPKQLPPSTYFQGGAIGRQWMVTMETACLRPSSSPFSTFPSPLGVHQDTFIGITARATAV